MGTAHAEKLPVKSPVRTTGGKTPAQSTLRHAIVLERPIATPALHQMVAAPEAGPSELTQSQVKEKGATMMRSGTTGGNNAKETRPPYMEENQP